MEFRQLIKNISSPLPVITISGLILVSICYLIMQSLQEDAAAELQSRMLLLGGIGILVLTFFLLTNCYTLFRQYRRHEIGSRLTAKFVSIFLILMIIPLSLIYFFSMQFLIKGVDTWFDVRVEQAVQDALTLGQTSLQAVVNEAQQDLQQYANNFPRDVDSQQLLNTLEEIRVAENYSELSFYTDDGRMLAFSSDNTAGLLPDTPSDEAFLSLRANTTYTSLEPISKINQQIRIIAPIQTQGLGRSFYALQAIKLLPMGYANVADSVETALNQYDQMLFARGPLKFSLIVTLSIISLMSLLFSVLTAVYLSRRLMAPISNLAAGTQDIAEGEYGTSLPVTSGDELGILTQSFNNMSAKIQQAQWLANQSQHETEAQRAYLDAVLTNLSSGVFVFDHDCRLQICNSAADEILASRLQGRTDITIDEITEENPRIEPLMNQIKDAIEEERSAWQFEINILGAHGRQILIVQLTQLAANESVKSSNEESNYVVVFDDVTSLIQAQRDAAWGEVARRLAHEIKNPLTPIQLSAERIFNKFSHHADGDLKQALESSTRTIVNQVEAMKEMVNAFSSYAQPVRATLYALDLNALIEEVINLHSSSLQSISVALDLDSSIPQIKANSVALRQVLNNLIINALHAVESSVRPRLAISTRRAAEIIGRYIDIVIVDNGIGIPSDIRDTMFDPYVSSKAKGSGLGLAVVKRIVEEHSGSVWASEAETGGTEIHIRLPINAEQSYRGNRSKNAVHS